MNCLDGSLLLHAARGPSIAPWHWPRLRSGWQSGESYDVGAEAEIVPLALDALLGYKRRKHENFALYPRFCISCRIFPSRSRTDPCATAASGEIRGQAYRQTC